MSAERPLTAGRLSKRRRSLPDLAILNLSIPVMNGLQAIPEMLKCAPRLKILIFTADDTPELRQEALRLGARRYISKSEPDALLAEVWKLLL
jgi:DNA-binding NarL/FixJ family response regulator